MAKKLKKSKAKKPKENKEENTIDMNQPMGAMPMMGGKMPMKKKQMKMRVLKKGV